MKTTEHFKIDLLLYVQDLAVETFSKMEDTYMRESSPTAVLKKKKFGYGEMFMIKAGQGDAAARFPETVLKSMILKNVEARMSPMVLFSELRSECGATFRDVKSLQAG